MKRFGFFLLFALVALGGSGCMAGYAQDVIFDQRYPGQRRGPDRHARYYDRIHHDARNYVRTLDRRLHLDRRQQNRIHHLLDARTERLLDRAHPRDHAYIYPFPRRFENRRQHEQVERWWYRTDQEIERYLDRRQRHEYRYLTGRDDYRRDRRNDHWRHRGDDDDDDDDD